MVPSSHFTYLILEFKNIVHMAIICVICKYICFFLLSTLSIILINGLYLFLNNSSKHFETSGLFFHFTISEGESVVEILRSVDSSK